MRKLRNFLPLAMLFSGAALTMASYVAGRIVDPGGGGYAGALVSLYRDADSVPAAGAYTDADGRFALPDVVPGKYRIAITSLDAKPANLSLTVPDSVDTLHIEPVTLNDDATMLAEVVVRGVKTAVIAKEDTLEYNADSYHTAVNATVGDLLKRLPGVTVGSDGSISSGGKTITKILVDGKEFFGDDPQAATKNLPSSMIDKVQVVDRKSDLARMTGVDDGEEETVINLTVKKGMQNGWFGNAEAGYGTDGRYKFSANINRFHDGNQITLLAGGNNINEIGFTDRGRGGFGGFGGNNGINSTQHFGINFNVGKGDSLRVGGNIIYSHSDRKAREFSETQYLFPDSTSYLSSFSGTRDRGHNISADFRLQWKIDPANTLEFRPSFRYSWRDQELNDTSALRAGDASRSLVNRSDKQRRVRGTSLSTSGNLIFNHNFLSHPGRSFSTQIQYSYSDTRQYENSWSRIAYYLLHQDDDELLRYLDTRSWSSTIDGRLTWTEPLGNTAHGNYLTVAYRLNYRFNNADRLTYGLDPELYLPLGRPGSDVPDGAELDNSLSNRFRNDFFSQELQVGYKKVSKNFNLQAGMIFSPSESKSDDLINDARSIPARWAWNFSPFLRLRWKMGQQRSLMANYRARTSQPSMTQLQPVADVSDPLHIKVGNPDLKPSFTQTLMVRFSDFNTDAQRSLNAMAHISYTTDDVVQKTTADPETGARTTTYANVNGNLNLMAMGMFSQPFRNRKWRLDARLMTSFRSTAGFIDGKKNRSGNFQLAPSAGITFTSDLFQLSVAPTYTLQRATSSLGQQPDRTLHSYGFTADGALYFPFGLELTTDLNMAATRGYSSGLNTTQWLWNAQLSYSFLRDKQLTVSLSVYDILQQKKNISRTVSAAMITDMRVNDLTRYGMVTLTWKFNTFGSRSNIPKIDGERRHPEGDGPAGPPPGGMPRGQRPAGPPPGM